MKNEKERPYEAHEYDTMIKQTLPYSMDIYEQALSIIETYGKIDGCLLDVGCGSGKFEQMLREKFVEIDITAIDPAEDMLNAAIDRDVPGVKYAIGTVLDYKGTFDIITAIMSHHLVKPELRKAVFQCVYDELSPGGIYVAFENVVPEDDIVREKELDRWADYQVKAGKSASEAAIHKARCGVYYFPMSVEKHIEMMKKVGFKHVYVFWRSYMQMGILGIK